jgi:PAS domain S-box-containing protein
MTARPEKDSLDQLQREIADRESAYRELARQRAVLQQIIDTIPHCIFWKDRQSVYLGANRKKLETLGLTAPDQLIGKTDYDTPVTRENAEHYRRIDGEVMTGGKVIVNHEETQVRSDGPHVLLTSKVPLRDEDGQVTGVLGSYIDITERKQMETELARAKEAAETAARSRTEFLATMSHELRTPLTLIMGPLQELLGRDDESLAGDVRVHLERIWRNADRISLLVDDILEFTKLEAGCAVVQWQRVDVTASVGVLVEDASSLAKQKGIALSFRADPSVGPAMLDRAHLDKIVINLLGNALKFTPAGGKVEVNLRSVDGNIELSVADTGPGIAADKHRIIFERFQQLDSSLTRRNPGTGLGLALVKELTQVMGGSVHVESAVGRGARFVVVLPRAPGDPSLLEAPAASDESGRTQERPAQFRRLSALFEAAQAAPSPPPPQPCAEALPEVLIAEDDPELRAYMAHLLASEYSVTVVEDGQRALEHAQRHPPAVMVADIMMPAVDGLELVSRLKADPELRRIPVILVTARAGCEAISGGLDRGAHDYLVKPFGPAELRARVRAAERQGRLLRELVEKHGHLERALADLQTAQDELVQVGKLAAVGTLVAGISHELNNPLATMLMAAQSLLRQLPPDSPVRRTAETIERNALRSGRLVTMLLDFSRRKPSNVEQVSVEDLVERVAELARSHICGGNALLEVERADDGLPPVQGSVQEIEVALLNVVKNAFDATEGGGEVRITQRYKRYDGAAGVEIAVRDAGCGIPPDVLPHVFDLFFTTKPTGQGTGLGLSLAHRIIDSHGGQIRVDSQPGHGTTVTLWLKAATM